MAYTINGEAFDAPGPEDVGGVTFVPVAKLVEGLGGYVTWNNATKVASLELGDKKVDVEEDNDNINVGGQTMTLSSRPSMGGGALWVPLDLFRDVLGCTVEENGSDISISNM
jgi:hypothetical protein